VALHSAPPLASLVVEAAGAAVALSHAAPSSHLVRDVAATSSVEDPETVEATDPETVEATDPETEEAVDPETEEAQEDPAYTLPECPADVKNHGAYVSSVAKDAPKGKDGHHGSYVSEAAKSDCGKNAGDAAEDPETDDATQDPETEDATQDPETEDAVDPETEDAGDTDTADATTKVKEHGHGASSWSGNGHGKNSG
jgi:hypothetical protein